MTSQATLVLLIFLGLAQGMARAAGHHKAQVSDRALGQAMAEGGARLIADYGGYQLFDAPDSMTNLAQLRDDYNLILLNANRLDTTKPEVKALRATVGGFAGKRMHLVQFAGPVQPAWRQALLDSGAQIVSYIPHNTYLIYGDAPAIARVQAQAAAAPYVQWEAAYLDEYKIHPSAKSDQFAIQMVADDAANLITLKLLDRLKLAPLRRQRRVLNFLDVVARVSPANLSQIAARPDVVSIQPYATPRKLCERQDQIVAGNLSGNVPSGPGYLAWLANHGFGPSQFRTFAVDVSDSGIDDGTTQPNHFGFYAQGVISSTNSRVIYNRLEGTPNPGSTLAGCDGHGNLNAHIVGGYDDRSGFPFEDSSGFHYGLGVCPFVSLGSSVIFDPTNWTDPSYEDLMSQAYEDGARISNNSWGDRDTDEAGLYNLDSQEYDALARDAQPDGSAYPAAGNQEMVIVFAAGNDGPYAGSVSPPATAKNVISVGASESVQMFGGTDGGADRGGTTDAMADDANSMAYFSSEGPCADGRQKPDLVAPGTHVSGGAPEAHDPKPAGTAEACFLELGTNVQVAGGSDDSFFFPDKGQEFYTASSGTSHSTPCVSGGCALLRQYFINQGWTPPSPAMTKAWLMNAARYLTGDLADDTLWSPSQGMGEMDLGSAFDGAPRLLRDEASGDMFTASGQTRVFSGVIANANAPFRVTLAWTDAPGNTIGAAYNNDLDLTVTVGGNTYLGNVFNGAFSVTGGSADQVDNVESVFLPAGVSGPFTVTVSGVGINSAGVPGAAGVVNQDFALVVYNAGPVPVLAAGGAVLALESCSPPNGTINPGENVTVDLTVQNAGSAATTNLAATLLGGGGVASPSCSQTYGALAPGSTGTAAFSFQAQGACGGIISATLQLQDGAADLGTVSYNFQLGQLVTATNYSQNFDAAAPPGLPAGWSSSDNGSGAAWSTEAGVSVSAPNAVYCLDSDFEDAVSLVSPAITLPAGPSQLSFQHSFNLEDEFDGGVLQIQIGGGGFEDILAAGGSFVTGGYTEPIIQEGARCPNPLGGANAWSGTTDGFMTTVVNLPASAQGQTIQLQWVCETDCNNDDFQGGTGGWWIDNVAITETNWSCCASAAAGQPVIFLPSNGYASAFAGINLAGTAAPNATLVLSDNGASNEIITADATGHFCAQTALDSGANILVLTETGTAFASAPVTVYLLPVPPTLQVAATSPTVAAVSGGGVPGAVVDVLTNGVAAAQFTNDASGAYAGSITLPGGAYLISATETVGGITSLPSAATNLAISALAPFVYPQPQSLTGFLKEKVTISAGAQGAAPLRIWWERDGVKISGATTANLTLPSLAANSAGSYVMIVSNRYGTGASQAAVLILAPNPFTDLTGTYFGLFAQTNAQFASSGFLKLTLSSLGGFSGSILNAGGGPYGFSGAFSIAGTAQASVSRGARLEPLIVNMSLDLTTNDTEQILGAVSNSVWSASLQADRATFSAHANPFPHPGKYTMSFENPSDGAASPGGDGYGQVSISAAGMVSWNGALADNTGVAPAAVSISKFGQWPLYVPLYGNLGSLSGWVSITNSAGFAGEVNWFRIGPDGKLYPAGFTNGLAVAGSAFAPGNVLGSTNLELTISGGGLGANVLTEAVTLLKTGKFAANGGNIPKLSLSVNPGTGVLSGSFQDPQSKQATAIKGIVLQNQTNAAGFFVSTNATGSVLLTVPY